MPRSRLLAPDPILVTRSRAMQEVARFIETVAQSTAHVLITGEPGAGKSHVAVLIHTLSRRADRPLVEIHAGEYSQQGFGLEMFGGRYGEPGAAPGRRLGALQLAGGGTLVLDEAADVPLVDQARLLGALESGEFLPDDELAPVSCDVRVLSLTTADLDAQVARGRFRRELLMRLGPAWVHVPALRDRRDDLPALAGQFVATYAARYRRPVTGLHPDALRALLAHDWPGNVRELDRTIASAVATARNRILVPDDLRFRSRMERSPRVEDMTLAEAERFLLKRALARAGHHAGRAAAALGVSHPELQRRRHRHGI